MVMPFVITSSGIRAVGFQQLEFSYPNVSYFSVP